MFSKIKLTNKCNNNCLKCRGDYSFNNEICFSIDKEALNSKEKILIPGREPAIDKNIYKVIAQIEKETPEKSISLPTNGRVLLNPFFREYFLRKDNLTLSVCFFGQNKETQDFFTRVPGSFQQSVMGLEKLIVKKVKDIKIRIMITDFNFFDIENIFIFFRKKFKKISRYEFQFVMSNKEDNHHGKKIFFFEKVKIVQMLLFKIITNENDVEFDILDIPYCLLNRYFWPIISFEKKQNKYFNDYCSACQFREKCSGLIYKNRENNAILNKTFLSKNISMGDRKKRNKIGLLDFYALVKDLLMMEKTVSAKYSFGALPYKIKENNNYSLIEIKDFWHKKISGLINPDDEIFNLYIHFPFCNSRCTYCMHSSEDGHSLDKIEKYLSRLFKEIDFYKNEFKRVKLSNIYFGGGTPSLLTTSQIKKILNKIDNSFNFLEEGQKNFECNPDSITAHKISTLREGGFTRISLGVQSFDKRVLKFANRDYQEYSNIRKAIREAQKNNLVINVDVMIGLYGDSVETVLDSMERLMILEPDTISLYPFLPSDLYLKKYFKIEINEYYDLLNKKIGIFFKKVKALSRKYGYFVPSRIFLNEGYSATFCHIKKEKENEIKGRYFDSNKPISILGVGSFSHSNIVDFIKYENRLGILNNLNPERKSYFGIEYTKKDKMRDYIFNYYSKNKKISRKRFKEIFHSDILEEFRDAFYFLKNQKAVKIEKDWIRFGIFSEEIMIVYALSFFSLDELLKINLD